MTNNTEIAKELREIIVSRVRKSYAFTLGELRALNAAADVVEKAGSDKEILSTVFCATVEELRDRHLALLRQSNKKDLPSGFDSWESYRKHIVQIQSERNALKEKVEELNQNLNKN